ncbi:hypothetical protein Tco_0467749 [Tanacetum coccineum]
MRISRFVHGITNAELIKRLHDKIPKTVDEMMRVTTSFLRGEVAASNHEQKKTFPSWKQHEVYISWYQESKFLIKMPPRRTRNINDVYERIMARMEERLDQFVDQFANQMNDIMNLRRCKDRNGRRSEGEELGNPFFEEESMPVYDTDIEDVIEEEEGFVGKGGFGEEEENMEDIVVVANDLCSSMI